MEPGSCVVQFLETNPWVTLGTAFAAFYIPVREGEEARGCRSQS